MVSQLERAELAKVLLIPVKRVMVDTTGVVEKVVVDFEGDGERAVLDELDSHQGLVACTVEAVSVSV